MDKSHRTRLKICGITNIDDAIMVSNLGADALGFVFAESKRRISPDAAREIIKTLPPYITTVGVFMDETSDEVNKISEYASLDAVQLHGSEPPSYCEEMNRKVIKGIKIEEKDTNESLIEKIKSYSVSAFILDPGTGSGKTFNWNIALGINRPLIIAGGLTPENVHQVIMNLRPYGVDVSSGVEKDFGKKDIEKVKKFIEEVRAC